MAKMHIFRKLSFVLLALFGVYVLARYVFGWIEIYRLPTVSMEPNFPQGKMVFCSNLPIPKRGDVVAFKDTIEPIYGAGKSKIETLLGRLAAVGGDEISLKNGRAIVNGAPTEEKLSLRFLYSVSKMGRSANSKFFSELPKDRAIPNYGNPESQLFFLDEADVQTLQGKENFKIFLPKLDGHETIYYPEIQHIIGRDTAWTLLDFGPIKVPEGTVFILGDNRQNVVDSRYRGFLSEENVVGKVIGKL